jgi:uncharacterized BrkB/YihY/UPF0761 family membrane protein
MQKQLAEAEPNVVHEILHHIREFFYLRLKELLGVFKETVSEWVNDKAPRLGASLAFYTLLSLAPLLIVIVAVAALVYGQEAARGQLVWQIQGLVGPDGARAIQGLVRGAYKPGTGVIATLLGFLTLAFGASSVVVELRDALNTIWHVPFDRSNAGLSNIFRLVKHRFYSFAMILGVGFLLAIGKQFIGIYLGKTSFGSTYGAAGSLVIVLVWVYYSAQLFFLGAEFTKVYTKTFGSQFARQFERVPPKPDNVIIDPSTNEPTTGSNCAYR